MIILEILLVIIGITAVAVSYRVMDSSPASNARERLEDEKTDAERERKEINKLQKELEKYKEEIKEYTSEELSRLSNEKIMGMNEYSEDVLDRISKNHEEVVFLYNMLQEKEEEIKDLVHHVDSVKALIHDETSQEYQKMTEALEMLKNSRIALENGTREETDEKMSVSTQELHSTQAEKLAKAAEKKSAPESLEKGRSADEADVESEEDQEKANHNKEIVKLYKEGHSVLEISKMLSLGQGEVKFVIDLYENR